MYRAILITLLLMPLTACSGKLVLLKNDTTGDIQKCEVSSATAMIRGMWMVNRDISRCVSALEKSGYKKIDG